MHDTRPIQRFISKLKGYIIVEQGGGGWMQNVVAKNVMALNLTLVNYSFKGFADAYHICLLEHLVCTITKHDQYFCTCTCDVHN